LAAREANRRPNDEVVQQGFLYRRWFNSIGKGDSAGPETTINLALGNATARFSSNFALILRSARTACRFTVTVSQITWIQCSVVWKGKAEQ